MNYDVNARVERELKEPTSDESQFGGAVGRELQKVTITTQMETRAHTFTNGEGRVADELTIKIKFNDAIIQPHSDFEEEFAEQAAAVLAGNIAGLMENSASYDDEEDDNDEGYF